MGKVSGIVSADDHVVEPPDLWQERLPSKYCESGPQVLRQRGMLVPGELAGGAAQLVFQESADGTLSDVWYYDKFRVPLLNGAAAAGFDRKDLEYRALIFDEIRPGCYKQKERLADMDLAGIEASMCFPNLFVRFCGQRFLFAEDRDLALLCVEAYNDFIVEEWCAGSNDRLIPCSIIPLWDVQLAAAEIYRMADKGCHAVSFSELPPYLGLPSIHTTHWDPFFSACEDTNTAIMLHVGSSSQMPYTSNDAPAAVAVALPSNNSAAALVDWLCSGQLVKFPKLKICLAESNMGWLPYFLERLDLLWTEKRKYLELEALTEAPSSYYRSNVFVTFFSDDYGTHNLDKIGEDNAMFETDYPHGDSTWPDCLDVAERQTAHLSEVAREKVLRGNARRLFGLQDPAILA